jgi:lysophospholipase L1-like esterase
VEEPVRHGVLGRWWARGRAAGWRMHDLSLARLNPVGRDLTAAGRRRWAAAASAAVVCGVAGAGLTGAVQPGSAAQVSGGQAARSARVPVANSKPVSNPATTGSRARTSCRSVVHIGDSTSDGLVSPDYLPNPRQRIGAQYAEVGVTQLITEISGGRSIVETVDHQPDAYTVAQQLVAKGYRGCWVLALGTNDTADVVVGSSVSRAARIQRMMSLIGHQPVMWVNVKSLNSSGAYAESDMQLWNAALAQACPRYPGMRVYDWAGAAQGNWFIADGIHYTSAGYAARSVGIAQALAAAFPATSSHTAHTGCVVH